MKIPIPKNNNRSRLTKFQMQEFYQRVNGIIANLTIEDHNKMKYVKSFIEKVQLTGIEDGDEITLGPMDNRMFEYFLYSVILDYETWTGTDKVKQQS